MTIVAVIAISLALGVAFGIRWNEESHRLQSIIDDVLATSDEPTQLPRSEALVG